MILDMIFEGSNCFSMEFLYLLENLRNPVLNVLMQFVTTFGEELLFMGIAMLFLWCVDKRRGYYLLTVGFLGTQINQVLKVLFRVPRPWVKDPTFSIVESARAEATGYSFPSGHTQVAVGTFGGIARTVSVKWIRYASIALCVLVPFSRMYLGVHTLLDTSVSVLIALALVFGLDWLFQKVYDHPDRMRMVMVGMLAWSLAQPLFMELFPFPHTADVTLIFSAKKNAYKMLGAVLGFNLVYELDQRFLHYEIDGSWLNRTLRFVLGLACTLGVKELADLLFGLLPGGYGSLTGKALSYLVLAVFAGAVWPLTFPYFKKLDQKLEKFIKR